MKPRDMEAFSPEKIRQTFHELQVHQIELEMQNEELRRSQQELSDAYRQYEDLYEFAPCGYLTLNPKGLIARINLAGAENLVSKTASSADLLKAIYHFARSRQDQGE